MSGSDNNQDAEDFVTVVEAARHLGVTVPRLRRALARDPWREAVREREHKTRTGTRTALFVPVSVLDTLVPVLSRETPGTEPERERAQERAQNRNRNENRGATANGSDAALLDQLRGEVAYLRDALNREQNLHAIALQALSQEQQRAATLEAQNAKLIEALPAPAAMPPQGDARPRDDAHFAPGSPETGEAAPGDHPEGAGDDAGVKLHKTTAGLEQAEGRRSSWWARLWRGAPAGYPGETGEGKEKR